MKHIKTIVEMIKALESIHAEHGNLKIALNDPDTSWILYIWLETEDSEDFKGVTINANY